MLAGSDARNLVRIGDVNHSESSLICMPHAGAGASVFYPWRSAFNDVATVWAASFPGREQRIAEAPLTSVSDMAESLLEPILRIASPNIILFGHCSGALIAFELARRLEGDDAGRAVRLIVSSQSPPLVRNSTGETPVRPRTDILSVTEYLRGVGGTPEALLRRQEFIDLVAPGILADMEAVSDYSYPAGDGPPLRSPVYAFGGRRDEKISVCDLQKWREVTSGGVEVILFESDHFYFFSEGVAVVREMRAIIASMLA